METTNIETITPETAKVYIAKNTRNRRVAKERVKYYSEQMKNGLWMLSSDAICFDTNGELLNGQHRLLAVVDCNLPQQFLVGRNYDPNTFKILDNGKTRTAADSFYVSGIKDANNMAATIRKQMLLRKGYSALRGGSHGGLPGVTLVTIGTTNKELLEEYDNNKSVYDVVTNEARSIYNNSRVLCLSDIAGTIAYLTIDTKRDFDTVVKFFTEICSLKESSSTTLEILRIRLLRDKMLPKKMTSSYKQGLIMKAWNYWIKGKEVKYFVYDPEKDKDIWFD